MDESVNQLTPRIPMSLDTLPSHNLSPRPLLCAIAEVYSFDFVLIYSYLTWTVHGQHSWLALQSGRFKSVCVCMKQQTISYSLIFDQLVVSGSTPLSTCFSVLSITQSYVIINHAFQLTPEQYKSSLFIT